MSRRGSGPFDIRAVLALVAVGSAVFVALLWMVGAGLASGPVNDGGAHGGGKGLNGYAGIAQLLEADGYEVHRSQNEGALREGGLLVLTPPAEASKRDLAKIVNDRRYRGPTLLILPKWLSTPVSESMGIPGAKKGWVILGNPHKPAWADELPGVGPLQIAFGNSAADHQPGWRGLGRAGTLPKDDTVMSMGSSRLVALVRDENWQMLAGYRADGSYPWLQEAAGMPVTEEEDSPYPLVIVSEPDLLNNYGMADRARARLALALVQAAMGEHRLPVIFDLTLNGHVRSANLLTLAFTPPFLAATLCLLLAALVAGWRAFIRFGPPRLAGRAIAFGKRALVSNAAGLIRRTRRLHLLGRPYADRARERMARVLALPRLPDNAAMEAAIDRALAARLDRPDAFSAAAARLRAARRPHELVKAAQDLHTLERTLRT